MSMRPSFMGFESMKTAIFTSQKSIDIVGHNLANVDTVGYTRQRVETETIYPFSSNSKTVSPTIALLGQGVESVGVEQLRDSFLDSKFREEYANASYFGKTEEILNDIQTALGDGADITNEAGLYGSLQSLYDALNDFVLEPTSVSNASIVMSRFENITQIMHQLNNGLENVAAQYIEDLEVDVDHINELGEQIAYLNKVISEDSTTLTNADNDRYGPNELLDQRNVLLDELSSYGNIEVTEFPDGTIDVKFLGHDFVNGYDSDKVTMEVNEDFQTVNLRWVSTNEAVSSVTSSGSLSASINYINGSDNNATIPNAEPYKGIPYYKSQLDIFANAFSDIANSTIPELDPTTGKAAVDADGNIIYKQLLGASAADGSVSLNGITAENISLSTQWKQEGSTYFMFDTENYVEDYAQQIADFLVGGEIDFQSYGSTFNGSLADFHVDILGTLAMDISFNDGRQQSYAQVANDFLEQRSSISGVSSDEETADLLRFQKSYEAAARVMTVMDEMLDTIINGTGTVGR